MPAVTASRPQTVIAKRADGGCDPVRIASRTWTGVLCLHAVDPRIGAWLERCCLFGRNFESFADGTHQRVMLRAGTTTTGPCRRQCAGTRDVISYVIPRPALEHCSSWSPVAPLTPTPPVTLPSAMIGTPPGEANTPGSVAVAIPPLLIASMKTRVVRR